MQKLQDEKDGHSRQVGDGEEGIRIEDVGFEESLQQVPRHWVTRGSTKTLRDEKDRIGGCDGGASSR